MTTHLPPDLIEAIAIAQGPDEALRYAAQVSDARTRAEVLCRIGCYQLEIGQDKEALQTLTSALGILDDPWRYYPSCIPLMVSAASALARAGHFELALSAIRAIGDWHDYRWHALFLIASELRSLTDREQALAVAQKMHSMAEQHADTSQRARELSLVADVLWQFGCATEAKDILDGCITEVEQLTDGPSRAKAYSAIALALIGLHEDLRAQVILDRASSAISETPTTSAEAEAAVEIGLGLLCLGQTAAAHGIYCRCVEISNRDGLPYHKYPLHDMKMTVTRIANALAMVRDLAGLRQMWSVIASGSGLECGDVDEYLPLVAALAELGDRQALEDLLARAHKVKRNPLVRLGLLKIAAEVFGELKDQDGLSRVEALIVEDDNAAVASAPWWRRWYDEWKVRNTWEPETTLATRRKGEYELRATLALAWARSGNMERSCTITDQVLEATRLVEQGGSYWRAWAELAVALAESGDRATAEAGLTQALNRQRSLSALHTTTQPLAIIAEAFSRIGEVGRAAALVEQYPFLEEILCGALTPLQKTGDTQGIEALRRTASRIRDTKDRVIALSCVVGAMVRRREAGTVRAIVDQVLSDLESSALDLERDEVLANLAGALASIGEFDRAIALARSIGAERQSARALSSIVETLILADYPERAWQTALGNAPQSTSAQAGSWLASSSYRSEPLAVLGRILASRNRESEILNRIIELTDAIPREDGGFWARNHLLSSVTCGFAQAGNIEKALPMLARVEGEGWQDKCRSALISAWVRLGKFDRAIQEAEQVKLNSTYVSAMCEIAIGLARVGEKDKADAIIVRALSHLEVVPQPYPKDIQAVAHAVETRVEPGNLWIKIWLQTAFSAARSRGRSTALDHIAAFVPVLHALGIVRSTWVVIQEVESMFETLGAFG